MKERIRLNYKILNLSEEELRRYSMQLLEIIDELINDFSDMDIDGNILHLSEQRDESICKAMRLLGLK